MTSCRGQNNQYLGDILPNSEVHPLEAGHFAWEETPEEYGRLVTDWISGRHPPPAGIYAGRWMEWAL